MKGLSPRSSCRYRRRGQGHMTPGLEPGLDSDASSPGSLHLCQLGMPLRVGEASRADVPASLSILRPHAARFRGRREAP